MRPSEELANMMPACRDEEFRVRMTTSCRDCDAIPKVPNAGAVIVENEQRVQVMHNGLRVVAGGYYGAWMTEIIRRLKGHHEPQEEAVFNALLSLLSDRACMIEVGGFWSYYSLWFLHGARDRRAIVIEPDPNHLEIGKRNAALNGLHVDFMLGCAGRENIPKMMFETETAGTIELPMVDIAGLIDQRGLDPLDLLHCDAQGAETEVIANCERHFRSGRIRFLIVSTHAEAITGDPLTHQRCLDAIQTLGGRVLIEHDVHESFSGDGLIAAQFGRGTIDPRIGPISYNRYSTSLFRNPAYDLKLARAQVIQMRELLARAGPR